jgi:hypothetical protein
MKGSSCTLHPKHEWVSAQPRAIWLAANWALEVAFKNGRDDNEILFGSQISGGFGSNLTLMPRGSKDRAFTSEFLDRLRGQERQLAPDVIDFRNRVFYEFKTECYAKDGARQLQSYYAISSQIIREAGGPPWKQENAHWLPPKEMSLPGDSQKTICTHLTNYSYSSGLILYSVWQKA